MLIQQQLFLINLQFIQDINKFIIIGSNISQFVIFINLLMSGPSKLIAAIKDQTQGTPNHMVFVIDIVSVRFGGTFTNQIKAQLQRYPYLQMLTLNDCGIQSLENFPRLHNLIRLDLVFNSIPGDHLKYLTQSKQLLTLMLGANKVEKIQDLEPLKNMSRLLQLDLINNPISRIPGYRQSVFTMLPSLTILDTLDKGGKDAYTNQSMMQAVSRIPDNLFDKSPIPIPIHVPHIHQRQKKKLSKALARVGSLDSAQDPIVNKRSAPRVSKVSNGKAKTNFHNSNTKSSRAGLVFPVGRIKRKLKAQMIGNRIGVGSAIYTAAILEYLSAQILQIAGNQAKAAKKTRITPVLIKAALKKDEQLTKLLKDVTIRLQ